MVGQAKITKVYNLPCDYVIHTVGSIWNGGRSKEEELLANCYYNVDDIHTAIYLNKKIRFNFYPEVDATEYKVFWLNSGISYEKKCSKAR